MQNMGVAIPNPLKDLWKSISGPFLIIVLLVGGVLGMITTALAKYADVHLGQLTLKVLNFLWEAGFFEGILAFIVAPAVVIGLILWGRANIRFFVIAEPDFGIIRILGKIWRVGEGIIGGLMIKATPLIDVWLLPGQKISREIADSVNSREGMPVGIAARYVYTLPPREYPELRKKFARAAGGNARDMNALAAWLDSMVITTLKGFLEREAVQFDADTLTGPTGVYDLIVLCNDRILPMVVRYLWREIGLSISQAYLTSVELPEVWAKSVEQRIATQNQAQASETYLTAIVNWFLVRGVPMAQAVHHATEIMQNWQWTSQGPQALPMFPIQGRGGQPQLPAPAIEA